MIFSLLIVIIPLLIVGGFSYFKSISVIDEKVSLSNLKTVQQIAENINFVLDDMNQSAIYLTQNKEFVQYLKLPDQEIKTSPNYLLVTQNAIHKFVAFKSNIHSIYVNGFNGLVFDSASNTNTIDIQLQNLLFGLRGEGMLIADQVIQYDGSIMPVISFIKVLKDIDDLSSDLAIIKINVEEEQFSAVYRDKLLGVNGDFFIIDERNTIISSLDKTMLGQQMDDKLNNPQLQHGKSGYFKTELNNMKFIQTYYSLSRPGWKLINLVPINELSKDTYVIRNITLYTVLGSFTVCLLMIFLFSFKVLSPLNRIRKAMKSLERENFNVNIHVRGNDEIALIGTSFNRMSKRMDELINEVYTVQIKQKEAELAALQAQINPHFLYNTLDTIYWMCRIEKAYESSHLVQALSKLFRLSLNSGNESTTVGNEIEHLKYYMAIQEKRFEDLIRFQLHVSEDILNCKTVKIVLQPLVENAIQHGIEKKGTKGNIVVSIYKEENQLIFLIIDDGAGADVAELNSFLGKVKENNRGLGIKNVNDRIRLYFGQPYGISFRSVLGQGTTVIVSQPYTEEEHT